MTPQRRTLRKRDNLQHGIHFALQLNIIIKDFSYGVMVNGKGLEGIFLDPARTFTIRLRLLVGEIWDPTQTPVRLVMSSAITLMDKNLSLGETEH